MARTCSMCGYTAQTDMSKRCVLCMAPFPEQERIIKLPSLATSENQNDGVENSSIGPRTAPATTRKNDLMIRRVVAVFTFLHGLAGLLGGLILFGGVVLMQVPVDLAILSLTTLAVVARGLCGLIGAVSLWRGMKIGFQLSILCWFYNVATGMIALTQLLFLDFSNPLILAVLPRQVGSILGRLLFGIPILYFLSTRLRERKAPIK